MDFIITVLFSMQFLSRQKHEGTQNKYSEVNSESFVLFYYFISIVTHQNIIRITHIHLRGNYLETKKNLTILHTFASIP